jgi:hypothetical protein
LQTLCPSVLFCSLKAWPARNLRNPLLWSCMTR